MRTPMLTDAIVAARTGEVTGVDEDEVRREEAEDFGRATGIIGFSE